jgi:hypothetical protein
MKPKTPKPKTHKLDIFETLAAIDRHDTQFLDRLDEDTRKGFAPPVVLRWASAVNSNTKDWYLIALNERANVHHYELYQHPILQYKLMASCGLGKVERHAWIAGSKNDKARKDFLSKYWPEANDLELTIVLNHLKEGTNLNDFLNGTGLQNDEIKKIKKLFE